jgi:hypothetical protein
VGGAIGVACGNSLLQANRAVAAKTAAAKGFLKLLMSSIVMMFCMS